MEIKYLNRKEILNLLKNSIKCIILLIMDYMLPNQDLLVFSKEKKFPSPAKLHTIKSCRLFLDRLYIVGKNFDGMNSIYMIETMKGNFQEFVILE